MSITLAVVGAVVGEFVGSNSGIGYLLQIANGNFDLPLMFAALTVLSAIGVVLFVAIDVVERLMIPWHASQRHDVACRVTRTNSARTVHEVELTLHVPRTRGPNRRRNRKCSSD